MPERRFFGKQEKFRAGDEMKKTDLDSSKKEEIVDAAGILFSTKGYKATTMKDIADEVSLHKTSLFHYFKNKEEILMRVMDKSLNEHLNILNEIVNNPELSPIEKLKIGMEKQVLVTCRYKHHINVYLNEARSLSPENRRKYNLKRKQYERYFEQIIKEVQKDKDSQLFKGLDARIVKLGILGMCNWIIKWYSEKGPASPAEIFQTFYTIVTKSPRV